MNGWDILLLALIAAAVAAAVAHVVRRRRRGENLCGGDCAHCAASCGRREKND